MRYESLLASRYIKAQKRQSVFTVISIASAVAVLTMIFLLYSVYIDCSRRTAYSSRPFHLAVHGLTEEQAEALVEDDAIRSFQLDLEKDDKAFACMLFGKDIGDKDIWLQDHLEKIGASELFAKEKYEWNTKLMQLDSIGDEAKFYDLRIFCLFFGFAVIIAFALRLVIDTAFEVSSKERERHYGVLRSIGATPEQIVRIITSEGLRLCMIAVPLGLAVGTGLAYLMYHALLAAGLAQLFQGMTNAKLSLPFSVDIRMLLISATVGIIWVFLSAYGVGMRAVRKAPMETITTRESDVKKIKRRSLSGLLFGVSGSLASRNARRQKKRFRITVLTLTVSITMFASFVTLVDSAEYAIIRTIDSNVYDCDFIVQLNYTDSGSYKESEQEIRDSGLFRDIGISMPLFVRDNDSGVRFIVEYVNRESYRKMFGDAPPVSYEELVSSGGYVCDLNSDKYKELSSSLEKGSLNVSVNTATVYADENDSEPIRRKKEKKETVSIDLAVKASGHGVKTFYAVHGTLIGAEETYADISRKYFKDDRNRPECYVTYAGSGSLNSADEKIMTDWFEEHRDNIEVTENIYRIRRTIHNVISSIRTFVLMLNILIAVMALIDLINIILTGIANRRGEMASLQCVGMTDRQLAGMTVIECLQFTGTALMISLILCAVLIFGTETIMTSLINSLYPDENDEIRKSMLDLIHFDHVMPFVRCIAASLTAFAAGCIASLIMLKKQASDSLSEQIRGSEIQLDLKKTHLFRNCLIALAGAALLIIAGLRTYSVISYCKDRKAYEEAGYLHLVKTDSGRMNVYRTGAENGKHTIVGIAGLGCNDYPVMTEELNELLGKDNTIVYPDHAGYGFSDDSDKPQTVEQVVSDMREALRNDGIKAPYILMAHSYGSYYALYWEAEYPDEVEAIVFFDGTTITEKDVWTTHMTDMFYSEKSLRQDIRHEQVREWFGFDRLFPAGHNEDEIAYGTAIFSKEQLELSDICDRKLYTSALVSEIFLEKQETEKLRRLIKPTGTPKLYFYTMPLSMEDAAVSYRLMEADYAAAGKKFTGTPEENAQNDWNMNGWYYKRLFSFDLEPFAEMIGNCRLVSCPGEHSIMYAQHPQEIADTILDFIAEND